MTTSNTLLGTTIHGSKLYRLDTPASDTDLKSLHLPSLRDCALLRATKNSQQKEGAGSEKEEHESFALQEFLRFAANGEDVTITMLHAQPGDILADSPVYEMLRKERHRFYTKRMAGALGYAKSQALKLGYRGNRMAVVEKVLAALKVAQAKGVARLYQCWDELPDGEHIVRTTSQGNRDAVDKRIYEVCGKGLPATVEPGYAIDILERLLAGYGDRVRAAKEMGGKDWKALSHSFRVGYQLKHIYLDGGFTFPLPESSFLRDVKAGRLSYVDDGLGERLDELIAEVEQLSEASTFPQNVSQKWMDDIVLEAYALRAAAVESPV